MEPAFPILLIDDETVTVFDTRDRFRGLVARATDAPTRDAYFRVARIIDSQLREHRVVETELLGKASWFRWPPKPLEVSKLRFECLATHVPFETVRTLTADAVTRSIDFWANTHDAEALLEDIRRSNGMKALLAAFDAASLDRRGS